jgi:Ni/Co efflux regulator RcnB
MRAHLLHLAFAGAITAASAVALAQPNDSPNLVPGNEAYNQENRWQEYAGPYDRRWFRERQRAYELQGVRGAGINRNLRIGERVPRELWREEYAVSDWRAHNLFRPGRNYRWFQAGADYILVEMPTGIIVQTRLTP